jgi:hypothetical protein
MDTASFWLPFGFCRGLPHYGPARHYKRTTDLTNQRLLLEIAERLNDYDAWRLTDLIDLSDRCYRIKCGQLPREAV